jgi:hypothetical protein
MSAPNLFGVTVTRTWSARMKALAWADCPHNAAKAAEAVENLDCFDSDDDGVDCDVRPVDAKFLSQLPAHTDTILLAPEPRTLGVRQSWRIVKNPLEFIAFLGGAEGERLRLAVIEHNNGQIALPIEIAA